MVIPPRSATDQYLANSKVSLSIAFDVDLGELIPGHHVVARGIGPAEPFVIPPGSIPVEFEREIIVYTGDCLHYEHVPGLAEGHVTPDWGFSTTDDVGTVYDGYDEGAYDGYRGGDATHGIRNLGGKVPSDASRLILTMVSGHDGSTGRQWDPPEPWSHQLVVDLTHCVVFG